MAGEPIIITSNSAPGSQRAGDVGGIFLHGRATTNQVNSCGGDSVASEGGAVGYFGGNDDNDCSGVLRYVRVEYAGKEITANNELNAFTWNSCGRNTRGDYLEAFRGADDAPAMNIIGDPAHCREIVSRFQAAGVDEIIAVMQCGTVPHDIVMQSIRTFAEQVMPQFS